MTQPRYLTHQEIGMIRRDWEVLLKSCEATPVTFEYRVGSGAVTIDNVYGITQYAEENASSFSGTAIQEVIELKDESVLRFGILEVGDCVFYTSTSVNLQPSGIIEGSMEIVETDNQLRWTPVPRNLKEFHNYLKARIGTGQVAQVIPCKLKK